MNRFREKVQSFMYGRYGTDELNRFLLIGGWVLYILCAILRRFSSGGAVGALTLIAELMVIFSLYRTLSRNFDKRRQENYRFLDKTEKFRSWSRFQQDRFNQRHEYAFFRCPGCRTMVRVPRGKGKIRITCRRCGQSFNKKT